VRSLASRLDKVQGDLLDLAANQSVQAVKLNQALYELSRLETLTASLEGEIEGLEAAIEGSDTAQISQLRSLITGIGGTAQQALSLAQQAIQLAAHNGGGENAARLQSQITQLKNNFDTQLGNINTRLESPQISQETERAISDLESTVTQLKTNLNENKSKDNEQDTKLKLLGDEFTKFKAETPQFASLSPQQELQVKDIADREIKTLTPSIVKENTVNPDELDKLLIKNNDKLINFLIPGLTLAILPQILPKLNQIRDTTNNIQNTPKSPCLAPAYVPPVGAKVDRNINLTNSLQGVTIFQGESTRNTVNAVNNTVSSINTTANTINTKLGNQLKGGIGGRIIGMYDRLNNSKAMQYFTTILVIHNAMMLSANIANTIGFALDAIVSLTPFKSFKDENDNEIPFVKLFGNTIEGLFIKMFGKEKVKDFEKKYAASMKIYRAGANMLNTVRSMMDSARDIAETTSIDVSEIGNALRRDGVVQNDAYGEMSTTPGTRAKFITKLEKLNQGASAISSISSDAVDIKDDWKELKEQRDEYKKTVDEAKKAYKIEEDKTKEAVSKLPEIKEDDEKEGEKKK
jgi:hypothetical protein